MRVAIPIEAMTPIVTQKSNGWVNRLGLKFIPMVDIAYAWIDPRIRLT